MTSDLDEWTFSIEEKSKVFGRQLMITAEITWKRIVRRMYLPYSLALKNKTPAERYGAMNPKFGLNNHSIGNVVTSNET